MSDEELRARVEALEEYVHVINSRWKSFVVGAVLGVIVSVVMFL